MRFMRFRTRIFLYFLLILLPAICIPSFYLYRTLDDEIYREAKKNAFTHLEFLHWLLEQQGRFESRRAMDQWYTRTGEMLGLRITLINAGGRVIADSEVPVEEVPQMENHLTREEVMAARRQGGAASSIRYSETVRRNLIYAAIPIDIADAPGGILRVAIPLSNIENRLEYFADRFWFVLVMVFLLAAAISFVLARYLEAPIQRIIQSTRAIGGGGYDQRLEINGGPEFAQLSDHINEMAGRIQQHIQKLEEQKKEVEAILEGMQEGVMLLDQNGHIKAVNTALTKIAKCGPTCIGRMPIEIFVKTEIQSACSEILAGKPCARLTVAMEPDRVFEINLVAIPEEGAVAVFHDISERVRLEKARQDFVANVSHELRTPLTSIKGYAETLLDSGPRPEGMEQSFLQTIVRNANHMANIVNDLLDLTNLQQKSRKSMMNPVDAALCLKASWETCLPLAREKQIELINRISGPLYVKGEEKLLIQVFRNLLDNAIRYSPPNTAITAAAVEAEKNTVIFDIEDQGSGIPKRHHHRIFERFYRVDTERSRASGGTGLGLAICQHAVRGMGGKIWVESPPQNKTRGTAFHFSLEKSAPPTSSDT